MLKSLFSKLIVLFLVLFTLFGGLVVFVTLISSQYYQQEVMQQLNQQVARHIVKQSQFLKDGNISKPFLEDLFHSLMLVNPNLEIYCLTPNGQIESYSAPADKIVRTSVDLAPVKRYLKGDFIGLLKGDDPRSLSKQKTFSVAEIKDNNVLKGYLYVILGGEQYDDQSAIIQGSHVQQLSIVVTVVGLILATLVATFVLFTMTRRLKKLSAVMSAFQQDNRYQVSKFLDYKQHGDEIDELSRTFREMSEQIKTQLIKLKNTDNLRRELVANVSHDLRTPLATLKGYMETLKIKDSQLGEQQREHYLNIAIKHCNHLNNLVDELFELAKLDTQDTRLNKEVFNLSELLQDIIQKFSMNATRKKIEISTSQPAASESYVEADIKLIERALGNLLDNAIRYTPESGKIHIATELTDNRIVVSITDNGSGIPEPDLPYIFDRFYVPQHHFPGERQRTGLGLAIVKRIVDLHSSQINVISHPGQMTTFSFFLPLVSRT
ncbi:MAG: HAMP domain-containing histidine kinase [Gammaproteobacteria bacterium]|nr:HAMP domain-containing histidine kinase [Gammaproteobacteria bacterium]